MPLFDALKWKGGRIFRKKEDRGGEDTEENSKKKTAGSSGILSQKNRK